MRSLPLTRPGGTLRMFRRRRYIFIRRSNRRLWVILLALLLAGAAAFALLRRPSVQVTARTDFDADPPVLAIVVEGPGTLHRLDLPPLNLSAPIRDGRGTLRIRLADLPPDLQEIAYILRETWYRPDRRGVLSFERPRELVNYLVRIEPDGEGGARLSLDGDPGNHVLLIDPREKVLMSGRASDVADPDGIARVVFSKASLDAAQSEDGSVSVRLRITSPAGEVDEREVIVRKAPPNAVDARVLFPPPGTVTDRRIVRVRILTEPKAIVRFGDDPEAYPGPRVEYDWRPAGPGRQLLNFEARVQGLRPKSGTIEIESTAAASAPTAASAAMETSGEWMTYGALAAKPEAHTGVPVALAGEVMAPPETRGGTALAEIGSGEEAIKGAVAVVYDRREAASLRKGDRIIARGTTEGPERLRTPSGWLLTVPKVRADEFEIEPRTAGRKQFRERYERSFAAFWRSRPADAPPTEEEARPQEILASEAPWPETPEPQKAVEVVDTTYVFGTGDQSPALPEAPLPEEPPPAETAEAGAGLRGEAAPGPPPLPPGPTAPAPEAAAGPAPVPPGPTAPAPEAAPGPAPAPAEATAPGTAAPEDVPAEVGPAGAPHAPPAWEPPAPPAPPGSWGRDQALESELAGQGVTGVRILRRGRSIRLRGSVASDLQLRTLYQFMNDKGFGEVDYEVEVR